MKVIKELYSVSYSDRLYIEKEIRKWMKKESMESRVVNICEWLDKNNLLNRKEIRKYVLIRKENIGE